MDVLGRYSYDVQGIPKDEVLLPEVLKRRGYHTGMVGKWHLGGTPGYLPNDRGFDSFFGALWSNDDQPYAIYKDRQVVLPSPADENQLTHEFTAAAVDYIRANASDPFFLYLAHAMPHFPTHASPDFRGTTQAGIYGDAVHELDWSVGQILDTLGQLGLAENTLVMLTSDNGPWWQGNPGFLRGRKLLCFEGGFRVPLYARWPGVLPAGTINDQMAVNFDLFSTALSMAGVNPPADRVIDGRDILPLLSGASASPHDTFYYYDTRWLIAVRYRHWKYHRRARTDNAAFWPLTQGPFLFDLETDPNESYSLLEEQPDLAARMSAMLDDFEKGVKSNLRGWL
jgi:arylsulfatase A